MPLQKCDYCFICSNTPAPRSIEKLRVAIDAGKRVLLVYLDRGRNLIIPEFPAQCEIIPISVSFRGVDFKRCIELIRLRNKIKQLFASKMEKSFDVYMDSLDILFICTLFSGKYDICYRLEIRDLNAIQLGRGVLSMFVRAIERNLIQRVSTLILTSEEYRRTYYHAIYNKRVEIVENWPNASDWQRFKKKPRGDTFVIGYIGQIRYMRCVYALVDAVNRLRNKGLNVIVKFAGGGELTDLQKHIGKKSGFEIIGSFNYSKDITDLYADVDLNFSVYDIRVKNVKYALPNKYYESILAHIPILVAEGTFLEHCVLNYKIGNAVKGDYVDSMATRIEEAYNGVPWYSNAFGQFKKIDVPDPEQLENIIARAVIGK